MRTHTHRCFVLPKSAVLPYRAILSTGADMNFMEIQRFLNKLLPDTSSCTVTGAIADVGPCVPALSLCLTPCYMPCGDSRFVCLCGPCCSSTL